MKDRIKQFIDYKGISAGDLASELDVQRSNISHILNGRNKPGAAFIEKFLLVFPDLNARWLLTGEGNMVNSETSRPEINPDNSTAVQAAPEITETAPPKTTKSHHLNNQPEVKQQSPHSKALDKVLLLHSDGTFVLYKPE